MYRTVCLVVLVAVSASAQFLGDERPLEDVEEKCVIETKIDRHAVATGDHNNERLVPEATRRCYIACILRERGLVYPNGTMHLENIMATLPNDLLYPEKISAGWEKCSHEDGGNSCDTAYLTSQCIAKQDEILRQEGAWERKEVAYTGQIYKR